MSVRYRVRQVGAARTWATFDTTVEMKPGRAADELVARVRGHKLPTAFRYQLEVHDPRRGWVVVVTQSA